MLSFIGNYACKLDSKGRLMVPASFREELRRGRGGDRGDRGDREGGDGVGGDGKMAVSVSVVLRRNIFEECIDVYPRGEWERLMEGLRERTSRFNEEHERFRRAFLRGAVEVELDGNGRMLVPRRMLEDGGVGAEAVLVGMDAKLELWEPGRLERGSMGAAEFARVTRELGL